MATKPPGQPKGLTLKFPEALDLKDLITIISVAVSLAVAWGVFSTRITVLEREVVTLHELNQSQDIAIDKLQQQMTRQSAHQQDDELFIDQLFMTLRRPVPTRRATN